MILLTVVLIVIILLILLTGTFFLTPLEFGLEIDKTANRNKTYICFRVLGLPVRIDLSSAGKDKKQKKVKKKESNFSFENFKEKISDFKEIYSTSKEELKEMLSYVRRHASIKRVDFQIHFGFDNAAATGISTGAIWAMGSFILKVIDTLIGIKKINMQVNPDFDNKIFEIYSKTILIMRPIHFIIILGRVLKTYKYVNNKINNIKGGV